MPQTTLDNAHLADVLAQTYAQTLYELAEEANTLDEVADELRQIVELVGQQDQLRALLDARSITAQERARIIEQLFKNRVSDLTYRFLRLLNDKERLGRLPGIQYAFDQRLKAQRGQVDVDLFSAHPIPDHQLDEVRSRISAALGREAVLHTHLDPSLIGGLKIRVGDKLIDASVASQLRRLQRQLNEQGREMARQHASQLLTEE